MQGASPHSGETVQSHSALVQEVGGTCVDPKGELGASPLGPHGDHSPALRDSGPILQHRSALWGASTLVQGLKGGLGLTVRGDVPPPLRLGFWGSVGRAVFCLEVPQRAQAFEGSGHGHSSTARWALWGVARCQEPLWSAISLEGQGSWGGAGHGLP